MTQLRHLAIDMILAAITMDKPSSRNQTMQECRCLYCGQLAPIVWVHGHDHCAACGSNVAECCQGETCTIAAERQK